MKAFAALPSDLDRAVGVLVDAFATDPITGYLLGHDSSYPGRLTQFFSLLMRARIELEMPVLVAKDAVGIHGAAMGYTTRRPAWPQELQQDWDRFEETDPGLTDRMASYDEIAEKYKPPAPHYYLGAIGIDPAARGLGMGTQLLNEFCEISAKDPHSSGVYLETANPMNIKFYERAGFAETGRGLLGRNALWCMFMSHAAQ